jgi:hypothetical protein
MARSGGEDSPTSRPTRSSGQQGAEDGGSRRLVDLELLVALVTVVLATTHTYVASEHTVYFWDHAVFQDIAWKTADAFRTSLDTGFEALRRSYRDDYNALFAVPLLPFSLLGESRLTFELAIALGYFAPFALAIGCLATRLTVGRTRVAFWAATWLTLLVPIAWVPGLRGYPDAGAALLVVLALAVQMEDLESQRIGSALSVGALLGLACLFRRHFVYAALAFLTTAVAFSTVRAASRACHRQPSLLPLLRSGRGVVLTAAALAATTAALSWDWVRRLLSLDFQVLYRGYETPVADVLRWYVAPYGWLAWIGATLGLLIGPLAGVMKRSCAGFLVLFAVISGMQWCLFVRQIGEQYTLHLTPVMVLGLLAFAGTVSQRLSGRARAAGATLGACYLVTNLSLGLGVAHLDPGRGSAWRPLFAAKWDPRQRFDEDEIGRLVTSLRGLTPETRVYVVGSSDVINPDLVRHAEWQAVGRRAATLNVLAAPDVDSRDYYPLGPLLDATAVVLARPVAYHLDPGAQRTMGVVDELFAEGLGVARDFTRLPMSFSLKSETTLSIYQRVRPTSLATALDTLRIIEQRLPARPGMQTDWIVVARAFPWWLSRNPDGSARWVAHPTRRKDVGSLTAAAYLGPTRQAVEVSGVLKFFDARCRGTTLAFSTLDAQGRLSTLAEVRRHPGENGWWKTVVPHPAGPLLLRLLDYADGSSIDYCLLEIDPLIAKEAS